MSRVRVRRSAALQVLLAALVLSVSSLRLGGQTPPTPSDDTSEREQETLLKLAKRATELANRLIAAPEKEAEVVAQELLKLGSQAIPFLLNKLAELKGDRLVKVIEQLEHLQGTTPTSLEEPTELGLSPADFEKLKQPSSADDAKQLGKLLYQKYLHALELYKARQYDSARNLADSIIAVEPHLTFRPDVQRLKILCEERLLASRQLAARMVSQKRIYEVGDTIEVIAVLENLTTRPLSIELATTQGANPEQKNPTKVAPAESDLFVTITYIEYDPFGDVHSLEKTEPMRVESPIALALNQPWKLSFKIETIRDNPLGAVYREYHVAAEMRAVSISPSSGFVPRKIVFEPVTLRVFPPPDIDLVLEKPLEYFTSALDAGNPLDIFLCAMLVPEKDVPKAVEFLIQALPKATEMGKRVLMNCLRLLTKEPIAFDEQAWLNWWKEKGK